MRLVSAVFILIVCGSASSAPLPQNSLLPRIKRSASKEEFNAAFLQSSQLQYQQRLQCKDDQFQSFATLTCEDCEKYCPDGKNMSLCGEECKMYYMKKMIEQKDRMIEASLKQSREQYEQQQAWKTPVIVIDTSMVIILTVLVAFLLWYIFCRHVPKNSEHIHTTPNADPDNKEYLEQKKLLMATEQGRNNRQESEASMENGAQ